MNNSTKFILIDDNEIDTKVNLNLLKIMNFGNILKFVMNFFWFQYFFGQDRS